MSSRLAVTALLAVMLAGCSGGKENDMTSFMLSSTAFDDGQQIPERFSCDGDDRPPPLSWSNPPSGTRSFALVVDDPDAPNGTFRHWAAWNIPPETMTLEEDSKVPQARNDFGNSGYGGPCPPKGHGQHRYRFKLYALDTDDLGLSPGSPVEEVERVAEEHQLGRAELTGTYERS